VTVIENLLKSLSWGKQISHSGKIGEHGAICYTFAHR